jgi:hypothetical protein
MAKRLFALAASAIIGLFFMTTYTFGQSGDEEDKSPNCCCKILDMEYSVAYNKDVFDYQLVTKDACASEQGVCVAADQCTE